MPAHDPGIVHGKVERPAVGTIEERNTELMLSLDDAWNGRDWDTFVARHKPDVIVHWPGRSDSTRGQAAHRLEGIEMNKTFPDNHVDNRPYKVFFASGDWTCLVARFSGTMTGPMRGPDGAEIPPTGKRFEVDFCTVARWDDGQIVEENLFYDLLGLMQQIGLSG
jgi:predicted ester cyclase